MLSTGKRRTCASNCSMSPCFLQVQGNELLRSHGIVVGLVTGFVFVVLGVFRVRIDRTAARLVGDHVAALQGLSQRIEARCQAFAIGGHHEADRAALVLERRCCRSCRCSPRARTPLPRPPVMSRNSSTTIRLAMGESIIPRRWYSRSRSRVWREIRPATGVWARITATALRRSSAESVAVAWRPGRAAHADLLRPQRLFLPFAVPQRPSASDRRPPPQPEKGRQHLEVVGRGFPSPDLRKNSRNAPRDHAAGIAK